MRDDSADYACEVPRGEGDTELGRLGIGLLWRRENVRVELLNDALEKEKPFQTLALPSSRIIVANPVMIPLYLTGLAFQTTCQAEDRIKRY